MSQTCRVCIIGAGAAGLAAARVFSENAWSVTVMEAKETLGGVWNHDGTNAMYKSLRTNLPKEIMAFTDFPFPSNLPSFVSHEDVLHYLERYADTYNLRQMIRFGQKVETVIPSCIYPLKTSLTGHSRKTKVEWLVNDTAYDAVIVANGHFQEIKQPSLHHDDFADNVCHSKLYDSPEPYSHLRVLIVGAGASGTDIAREVARVAKQVIWSHSSFCNPKNWPQDLPKNIFLTGKVSAIDSCGGLSLDNGIVQPTIENTTRFIVDKVIYATGYSYDFPFLPSHVVSKLEGTLNSGNSSATKLFLNFVHQDYPLSLFFIGLPFTIIPFPLFETQCTAARVLAEGLFDAQVLSLLPIYPTKLGLLQYSYIHLLEQILPQNEAKALEVAGAITDQSLMLDNSQLPCYLRFLSELNKDTIENRKNNPNNYRERNYSIFTNYEINSAETLTLKHLKKMTWEKSENARIKN